MKPKLLILVGRNPKNMRGGASTWILNIDSYFQKDYEVDYLIIPEKWLNVSFIPDRLKAIIQAFYILTFNYKKWDVFLSHSPELSYVATLFSKNVVHIAHGNTNPMAKPTFKFGKLFYNLFEYFNQKVEEKSCLLYTVGEEKDKYKKINQPINHNVTPLDVTDKKGFVFAGRLEKVKNIDFIIQSYNLLPEHIKSKNSLLIFGRGSEQSKLDGLIKELKLEKRIFLKGQINNHDLIQEINKSKMLLMASSFEGFPMVVAEALTVGTPVLSTDVGSISDIVKNGYNGFCVTLDTYAELYTLKMEEILKNHSTFSENAFTSSKVFNAWKVYRIIHDDIKNIAN